MRRLAGVWRWLLIVATGADDLPLHQPAVHAALLHRLHAAQHRIFLSAHSLHAAVHVPDLSGNGYGIARSRSLVRRRPVRRDDRLVGLPDDERPRGGRARLGVLRRADAGRCRRVCHVGDPDGGAAPHRRLEPAAQRSPLHGLSAVRRRALARAAARPGVVARAGDRLSHALERERARHSDPGLRRHGDRLPGVRHRADDDGRGQVLHQSRVRAVRHVPRRRRQGRASSRAGCSA